MSAERRWQRLRGLWALGESDRQGTLHRRGRRPARAESSGLLYGRRLTVTHTSDLTYSSNMVTSAIEGHSLYEKCSRVTSRFLDVALDFVGTIPYDEFLRRTAGQYKTACAA
jgi:hypothetical protein